MIIPAFMKTFLLGIYMCFSGLGECSQDVIDATQEKIFKQVEQMRTECDSKLGEGVFDGLVSGKIDIVAFLMTEDLEEFLDRHSIDMPK